MYKFQCRKKYLIILNNHKNKHIDSLIEEILIYDEVKHNILNIQIDFKHNDIYQFMINNDAWFIAAAVLLHPRTYDIFIVYWLFLVIMNLCILFINIHNIFIFIFMFYFIITWWWPMVETSCYYLIYEHSQRYQLVKNIHFLYEHV